MANARRRGKTFELEVATICRNHGFVNAGRTSDGRTQNGRGDIAGIPGYSIECKRTNAFSIRTSWAQATDQCLPGERPIVVTRWDRGPLLSVVAFEDLLRLIESDQR